MAYGNTSYGITNPYGKGQTIITGISDQKGKPGRYLRHLLSGTPLYLSEDAESPLSNIIDAIEASDYDIGGSTR